MKHGLLIVLLACTFGLTGPCDVSQGAANDAIPSPARTPNDFWAQVPKSPSTTMPDEIRDGYWRGQFERVSREVAAAKGSEVVFFGDSITLNWTSNEGKGKKVWEESFAKYKPINMGNSGDITPVMLYRVAHGNLDFPKGQHPKVAVLLCGTNNFVVTQSAGGKEKWDLGANCPPVDVAHGVRAIAQEFRRRLPQTRLIIMGILPVATAAKRDKVRQVNEHLAGIEFKKNEAVYLDLWGTFTNEDGTVKKDLFTDGTHLTEEGYRVWAKALEPLIAEMVDGKGR